LNPGCYEKCGINGGDFSCLAKYAIAGCEENEIIPYSYKIPKHNKTLIKNSAYSGKTFVLHKISNIKSSSS
jgi:hypothetical protein